MKVYNCWCKKASPIRLVQESHTAITYECLQCHGTITVILEQGGETWTDERTQYGGRNPLQLLPLQS